MERPEQRDPDEQRLPAEDTPTEPVEAPIETPVDEASYAASGAESGGQYNQDGPTAVNVGGDTMGTRDEAEPGEEPESDPYSG